MGENTHVLWLAGKRVFEQLGRGAIVVDTNTIMRQSDHAGNPMCYLTVEQTEDNTWESVIKMVHEYDPSWEMVAVLSKKNRETAHRIGVRFAKK